MMNCEQPTQDSRHRFPMFHAHFQQIPTYIPIQSDKTGKGRHSRQHYYNHSKSWKYYSQYSYKL